MGNSVSYFIIGTLTLVACLLAWRHSQGQKQFPPGPPRKFLIGNLKDVPSGGQEWIAYEKMGKACGVYQLCNPAFSGRVVFGQPRTIQEATSST